MGRIRFTEREWRDDPQFATLCDAFLRCRSKKEVANFLRDIATLTELKAMSERLAIADRLKAGKTYLDIANELGASPTTISRVAEFLFDGAGGYRSVLPRHHRASVKARAKEVASKSR